MATKNIEIQDSTGNIYYLHTDASIVKFGDSNVNATLSDIVKNISNDVILTPSINYGMNNKINNTGEVTNSPQFTIQGKTVVNLLGKDGNCEDASKWTNWQTATTLDASNKVFGTYGMKVALTSTQGNTAKLYAWGSTKYYCLSAYLKCGTASSISIAKDSNGGGTWKTSPSMTDTTKFNRTFVKLQPSDLKNGDNVVVVPIGTTVGQYGYVDGIMLEEITQAQYNDSTFTPSPYVDSYACLQNPYIEVRHDNLVRNGNGEEGTAWWTQQNYATMSIVNNKFQLVTTQNGWGAIQNVKLKPNTAYYLYGNVSGNTQIYVNRDVGQGGGIYRTGVGTFNTGSGNTDFYIYIYNATLGTGTADSIMLLEGTTAPSSYKPCRLERTVLETKLTSDDSITYKNGEVTGQIWWKHKTLYGKDYDWQFQLDFTGYKRFFAQLSPTNLVASATKYSSVGALIKYDGKLLVRDTNCATGDTFVMQGLDTPWDGQCYISTADTDTGWSESVNPNNDEVKAFMNGWKAVDYFTTTGRYCTWQSVIDGSFPPVTIQTTATATSTGTTATIASAVFSAGDSINVFNSAGARKGAYNVVSVSGNTIAFTGSVNISSGDILVKNDSNIVSYCKNNVAPYYDGYQLHYKLQDPEPITDDNCHIHGDIPLFDVGDNYLYLDSGMVLGEVTPLGWSETAGRYRQNYIDGLVFNPFKYKTEFITGIYKDAKYDNIEWSIIDYLNVKTGNQWLQSVTIGRDGVDSSAIYTVDYKILATIAPQIGTISCSYSQDINSAISNIQESLNNKQVHDSILDQIVDKSLYEVQVMSDYYHILPHVHCYGTTIYVDFRINFSPKKIIPSINYSGMSILVGNTYSGNDYTNKFFVGGIFVTTNYAVIRMMSTDPTVVSNVDAYGAFGKLTNFTADCRGRI
ncbi:hypothetical protein [Clostridium beijerinckii]|uniref:hypothetical protein n=1 Tax=Clostridium beijerinckii TaxID=1520 RepID=UPI000809AFF9|nr:hypothetical protein [Clostridium beijerinckii]OCB00602.1 hypothetical protein BGS1_15060 [Clostridium beijerinckii]